MQVWVLVVCVCAFASHELTFWAAGGVDDTLRARPRIAALREFVAKGAGMNLPIVVANGLDFLPLAFYGTGQSIPLLAVTDVEGARRYTGTDSIDLDLMALRRHVDVEVQDLASFTRQHRVFLLLATAGPDNWWPGRLVDEGYALAVVARTASYALYRVEAPTAPTEPP
jgi:hypothetical protein